MKGKYYTPRIEEFHVGFQYESLDSGNNTWNSVLLTDKIMLQNLVFPLQNKQQGFLSYINDELNKNNIRVKYLDKEDIESFGFIQTIKDQYYKDDFELLIDDDLFIQIIKDDSFMFQGTIKNKSELKKLLIQLGIINE